MTILLVDDHDLLRENIAEFLRSIGYDVIEAKNGKEALQIVKQAVVPIEVVVSDLDMPEIDGITMWGQMKPMVPPSCKVIFIFRKP